MTTAGVLIDVIATMMMMTMIERHHPQHSAVAR